MFILEVKAIYTHSWIFTEISSLKMRRLTTKLLFCILFIVLHSWTVFSQEYENEKEFDYDENSKRGPSKWGTLHPEWSLCSNGRMQSPIDILNKRVEIDYCLGRLKKDYEPSNAILKNRGHDIKLEWEGGAGEIEIEGSQYVLQQAHWHSPSEHTINGVKFAAELHMVHQTVDNKIAVVSILYKIGRPDTFLSSLEEYLREMMDISKDKKAVGIIDPNQIKMDAREYYRYVGSLTTPPCTENVVWTIIKKMGTITKEQVKMLRVAVHDKSNTNARPIQSLNKRVIRLFQPYTGSYEA